MSVALGYAHNHLVTAEFMTSVRKAEHHYQARGDSLLVLDEWSGPNVDDARNKLVRSFLDSGRDWLYMCDTDTLFAPDTIDKLAGHGIEGKMIVSGLCYVNDSPPFPMMYRRIGDISVNAGMFHVPEEWMRAAWPRSEQGGECVRVDAVGAGCLLVHRDVYLEVEKRMPNPAATWYQATQYMDKIIGEDFTFCMRAADCGFLIWVDTTVRVGHTKSRVI